MNDMRIKQETLGRIRCIRNFPRRWNENETGDAFISRRPFLFDS